MARYGRFWAFLGAASRQGAQCTGIRLARPQSPRGAFPAASSIRVKQAREPEAFGRIDGEDGGSNRVGAFGRIVRETPNRSGP